VETLLLDVGFSPVARVSWRRAITLLFEGKVEVVESYEDKTVRSVTLEMKVPAVVRFLRFIRGKKRSVKFSRENVWARDRGACQYCGAKCARHEFTYDHVTPRAQAGKTDWHNVVVCCMACNQKKGGRRPEQAGMVLRTQPVRPKTLPDVARLTLTWQKGMPMPWRQWLASVAYWNGELEE
jgi:5-methylcytosine-specific restriction endonuclease McrA